MQHPDQLAALAADNSLMVNAADEIVRWVSPVKHFMRTAQEDCEIRGQAIAKGDWILLSYQSSNRDEDVFADPFRFDIRRPALKLPGVGRLTVTAINQRNYTVVQGAVLVIAALFIIVNLVTDLVYGWLDPRIDAGGER